MLNDLMVLSFDIAVPADGKYMVICNRKNSGDNYADDSFDLQIYFFIARLTVDETKLDSLIGSVGVKNDVDDSNRNHRGHQAPVH